MVNRFRQFVICVIILYGSCTFSVSGASTPEPYFVNENLNIQWDYNAWGGCTGVSFARDIGNRGAAGDVFVEVKRIETGDIASCVFPMDENEEVEVKVHFSAAGHNPGFASAAWTLRPAEPGDVDKGAVYIHRFGNFTRIAELPCGFYDIEVVNDSVYLINTTWSFDGHAYLRQFDIRDPSDPVEGEKNVKLGTTMAFSAFQFEIADGYAYAIVGHDDDLNETGLYVVDLNTSRVVGHYGVEVFNQTGTEGSQYEKPVSIAVADGFAYVGTERNHLHIFDISDPLSVRKIGECECRAENIAVAGDYAYVAGDVLDVIDVSDPSHPVKVAQIEGLERSGMQSPGDDLAYHNATLSLFSDNERLSLVNVSDPVHPSVMATWVPAWYEENSYYSGCSLAVEQDRVYLTTRGGLVVLDVSDPSHPVQVNWCQILKSDPVAVHDGLIFVKDAILRETA